MARAGAKRGVSPPAACTASCVARDAALARQAGWCEPHDRAGFPRYR